jgi:hypothetical protein
MMLEDFARVRFDLAEGDSLKAAAALKTKREASDAGEKIKKIVNSHLSANLVF